MTFKTAKISVLLLIALTAMLLSGNASHAYDVAVVKSADIKPYNDALEGFKKSCACSVEDLSASEGEYSEVIRNIRKMGPDAVFAIGLDALVHLQAVRDIPVVYTMVPNPGANISDRKNVSGVSMYIPPGDYMNAAVAVLPHAKRIGIVYNPKNMKVFVDEAAQLAQEKGLELVLKAAHASNEVPALIDSMKDKVDLLWMLPDTTVVNSVALDYMLLFSFRNRVPVLTFSRKYVEMGALASLNVDPFDLGAQAGELASSIAAEKRPRGGSKVNARKTVLTVNKKVAAKLGIKIRDEVLRKADVIH